MDCRVNFRFLRRIIIVILQMEWNFFFNLRLGDIRAEIIGELVRFLLVQSTLLLAFDSLLSYYRSMYTTSKQFLALLSFPSSIA